MEDQLAFMTPQHHAVRTFAVQELPRTGKPLSPAHIAKALGLDPRLVTDLLADLEKHLFFLVRNGRGEVNWAFPVTADRTPHQLRFSTGEKIFGA